MSGEFDLIRRYAPAGAQRPDVRLGSGDDAAILEVPAGQALVATVDTLVAGRHFPEATAAYDIGWKALAVNLSDLAAMGAEPAWATVALTLPPNQAERERWMKEFSAGLQALAEESGVAIVGGDLTAGPLSVTIQALGLVAVGKAIRRDGAQPGDAIAVTGCLGEAALALQLLQAGSSVPEALLIRLNRPRPRLQLGQALAGQAHAGIDVSDGLLADLGHILDASQVGARLHAEQLPLSSSYREHCAQEDRYRLALSGGDDYELCVCLPPERVMAVEGLTVIGEITADPGLQLLDANGAVLEFEQAGYDHFR